jgi:hypothetical protein
MIKRTILIATLAVLTLVLAVPAFPGAIPAKIVPENARWVAHLDMEKFAATELFTALEKDGQFRVKTRDMDRWLKMDPVKDIRGVTAVGFGPGDDKIAIIVEGRLDKAGLIAKAESEEDLRKTAYGAYTLYSGDGDGCAAFITDNMVVLSESRSLVEKVLDTAGGKAKDFGGTPLSASLKDVPAGAFISGVLPDLSGLSRLNSQSKVLEQASGLFFMAQEKSGLLLLRLQVTAATPESAKNMADVVNGIVAMGRLGGNEGDMAKVAAMLDGLQVKLDGKVLRLDFERPSKDIAALVSHRHGLAGILD